MQIKIRSHITQLLFSSVLLFVSTSVYSQIRLPKLISDGMVLQREQKIKLWGWASPGENVTLSFNKAQIKTVTDKDGKWMIELSPVKAGGPYQMVFNGKNSVTVSDILFGDVWLCSGQSNMELTMDRVKEKYASYVAASRNNTIRQFEVPDQYDFKAPHEDLNGGKWISADPRSILKFSAVAYFFALRLQEKYGYRRNTVCPLASSMLLLAAHRPKPGSVKIL
jgi:sialate O-acetylesterase